MKKLFLLIIFCHVASSVKHSLTTLFTGSTGVPNLPQFVGVVMVDDTEVIYCNSNMNRAEPKQDWMKKVMEDDPEHMNWYTEECRLTHRFFSSTIESLSNRTGDVHTFQRIYGCEQDEEVDPVDEYGYDGRDFLQFNLTSKTWSASTEQAINTQPQWNQDKERITSFLTQRCPDYLKKYLHYGNNTLQRTELPSVSLLQKTSSSPVSCHTSGFYNDGIRAKLIWRKDGEEIHENVDHGEILPNHDGTFQMSVDLDLSSVTPADWRRYECVFQLSGVKDDIVTRLDKDVIRTNEVCSPGFSAGSVNGSVGTGLLLVLLFCIINLSRKKTNLCDVNMDLNLSDWMATEDDNTAAADDPCD